MMRLGRIASAKNLRSLPRKRETCSEFAARPIQPDVFPLDCGRGGHTISEYWKNIPDLPDVSSCLVERRQPPATLHGVVFDILAARACGGEFLHRHPQLCRPAKAKGRQIALPPPSIPGRGHYFRLDIAVRSTESLAIPVAPHQLEPAPVGLIGVTLVVPPAV